FMLPPTRNIFIGITPLSLLLVISSVFFFDRNRTPGLLAWGAFIVVSSYFLEYFGIATGRIFGEYHYGRGLAPLIRDTPIIIGLNWLFLIYCTHLMAIRIWKSPAGRIFGASILMVAYDVVLEWVAPYMQMWSFEQGYPPFKNFAVWFMASVVYHTGFELFPIRYDNSSARTLYVIQMVFFVVIGTYSQLFLK
ncbi:MAG: carotenoid biosynthesis protein, partial [Alistipes sp.]|nr:carotenoid biosynthesis protein [Alistipes sp.]